MLEKKHGKTKTWTEPPRELILVLQREWSKHTYTPHRLTKQWLMRNTVLEDTVQPAGKNGWGLCKRHKLEQRG